MAAELAAVDEHFDSTIEVGMSLSDGVELLPRLVKKFHVIHPEAMVHLDAGYEPVKAPYDCTPQPVSVSKLLQWPMIIYEWESGRHMAGNRHFRERYICSWICAFGWFGELWPH